jgi:hypothetical protein
MLGLVRGLGSLYQFSPGKARKSPTKLANNLLRQENELESATMNKMIKSNIHQASSVPSPRKPSESPYRQRCIPSRIYQVSDAHLSPRELHTHHVRSCVLHLYARAVATAKMGCCYIFRSNCGRAMVRVRCRREACELPDAADGSTD